MVASPGANPPHHLLLGNDAYEGAIAQLTDLRGDFARFEAVSRSADFPKSDTPKAAAHRTA